MAVLVVHSLARGGCYRSEQLHEGRFVLFPPVASVDGRAGLAWDGKPTSPTVQSDYAIDDVPAENASQGQNFCPSIVDQFRHPQPCIPGALHSHVPTHWRADIQLRESSTVGPLGPHQKALQS